MEKILYFILMFAILNTIRDGISFGFSWLNNKKFEMSKWRLLGLGLSLSYILTIIFTGFKF